MALLEKPKAQEVVYNSAYTDQLDGPVYINQASIVDVTRENPGRTFVGILPGHSRSAFVRKRRSSGFRLPSIFSSRYADDYTEERSYRCTVRSPADYPVYVNNDYGPRQLPYGLKFATGKHTCGNCGKFRSPSYNKRHPLSQGEQPAKSLCRKCAKKSTEDSDDSYEQHRKDQKRRRRREGSSDEEWWRKRRERRERGSRGSGDYSYSHEEESYRGPRRRYSVDERYSHSDHESRPRRQIVYIDESSSCGHTGSRSGSEASVAISFKSREPRRIRRDSRSRSSAEEIRVVRRVFEEPRRKRRGRSSSMSEKSYRHYRSRSGSSGRKSVRFGSPMRRGRGRGYDGVASSDQPAREPVQDRQKPVVLAIEPSDEYDRGGSSDFRRSGAPSPLGRRSHDHGGSHSERLERPPSRTFRHLRGSSEIRDAAAKYKSEQRGRRSSASSFMSGARGRSLSDERHAARRERSRSRERTDAGSRRVSKVRYATSNDDYSTLHERRQQEIRTSHLMQRLGKENSRDDDSTRNTSLQPKPDIVYRHIFTTSKPFAMPATCTKPLYVADSSAAVQLFQAP